VILSGFVKDSVFMLKDFLVEKETKLKVETGQKAEQPVTVPLSKSFPSRMANPRCQGPLQTVSFSPLRAPAWLHP